jgi:hypothetical protein
MNTNERTNEAADQQQRNNEEADRSARDEHNSKGEKSAQVAIELQSGVGRREACWTDLRARRA